MKTVLSTKVKYLRLGQGPEFGVGKFIVIICVGATALPLYSGVSSGQGCEALAIKGLQGLHKRILLFFRLGVLGYQMWNVTW